MEITNDAAARAAPRVAEGRVAAGRAFAWLLVLGGGAGLIASWGITLDKIKLLYDPNYTPGCSINSVVSCSDIMASDQASVFGFPNSMLGLVAYGIVVCVGVSLLAGGRFRRWYWLTLHAGTLFGIGFCTWLQFESLYRINAVCLWCCLAWIATTILFWYVTSFNFRYGVFSVPGWVKVFFSEFAWAPPVLHIGITAILILVRWWDFWAS